MRDHLLAQYKPLARRTAALYLRRFRGLATIDDLESIALAAVWRASLRWKIGNFEHFVSRAIRNAFVDALRRLSVSSRRAPLLLPTFFAIGDDELVESSPSPEAQAIQAEHRDALLRALAELPEREALIIRRRYFRDETQAVVAASLGVSEPRISQIETRAIENLRRLLKDKS